jgi:hypothetical protein
VRESAVATFAQAHRIARAPGSPADRTILDEAVDIVPSWLLVVLQFALMGVLIVTTQALATPLANGAAFAW